MTWSLIIDRVPPKSWKSPHSSWVSLSCIIKIRMKTLNTVDIPKQHKTIPAGLSLRFIHREHILVHCVLYNRQLRKKMANHWQT